MGIFSLSIRQKTGGFGYISESAVAIVAVQNVVAEIGTEDVVEAIIVVVPDANAASPTDAMQSGSLGNVCKRSIAIVLVQAIGGAFGSAVETCAGENEEIHPAVVVVIDESAAATRGFDDVLVAFNAAVNDGRVQSTFLRDIDEVRIEWTARWRGPGEGLGGVRRNSLRPQAIAAEGERGPNPKTGESSPTKPHERRRHRNRMADPRLLPQDAHKLAEQLTARGLAACDFLGKARLTGAYLRLRFRL